MWKSATLCAGLFGGVSLALTAVTNFADASLLAPIAALGLCAIGVVLIRSAPARGTNNILVEALPKAGLPVEQAGQTSAAGEGGLAKQVSMKKPA